MFHSKTKDISDHPSGSYAVRWFIDRMQKTFNILVSKDNVSYEAYVFNQEDINDSLIPVEHLHELPDPLPLQCYQHTDRCGNEWVAGMVIEEGTKKLLYEIWLKNGKAVAYEIYFD